MKSLLILLSSCAFIVGCSVPTIGEEGDITRDDLNEAACLGTRQNEDKSYTPRKIGDLDYNERILYIDCMKKI